MKKYYINVQANKSYHVRAKNKKEARKKVTEKFKKSPGRLEMDIEEHDDDWRGYPIF